jgi:hypothetical protein
MKHNNPILAYLVLSFLLCYTASAQLPVQQEPHHKVLLENEYIRLLDGHVPFHDTTLAHQHAANSVVVFLSKSTFGIQIVGGSPVMTEVSRGDIKYLAYGDKAVTHIVWNQDTSMFHFMVMEIKRQHPAIDTCPIIAQTGVKLQWQQKLVRAYYLDIDKGQLYHFEKSNCAHLLMDLSGSIKISSARAIRSLQADGFAFFPPKSNIGIIASNKESARCILLELK